MFTNFSHPCTRVDVLAGVAINVLLTVVVSDVVMAVVVVAVHVFCDIFPDEPVNMFFLLDFEWNQVGRQRVFPNDFACQNM